MWPKKAFKNDKPPTDYENDEKTSLADSDVKSRYKALSESGDEWEKATLVSGRRSEASSIADTICDSIAPTSVGSKRSARKGWQPPGLRAGASEPTVGFMDVEQHKTNTYPEGHHIAQLRKEYKRRLQAMRPVLPPSAPSTDDLKSGDHGECTTVVVYRPHRATVRSQYHPWDECCRPATDPRTLAAPPTADALSKGFDELMSRAHHARSRSLHYPKGTRVADSNLWLPSGRFTSSGSKDPFPLQAQAACADNPPFLKHSGYLERWDGLPDDLKVGRDPNW